ncbi:Hypothetical_protein [Hexamita inflata]|uniref:Hypothetical_protein n=1 Tax=Hexamita inflata TaxID=28002 RepID=A0AA86QLJ6_9EUKA|nr:Hypothetical protein HINF_LOCUS48500 [Hexamita inflata]
MPLCPQEFTKQNFHRFAFPLFLSKTSLHYFENALASELQKSRTQIFCGWCLKRQRSPDTIVRRPNICQAPVSALDAVRCSFQVSFYDVGHSSRRQVGAQQSFCVSNTSKLPSIHQRPTGENAQLGRHQKQRAFRCVKMNPGSEHRCALAENGLSLNRTQRRNKREPKYVRTRASPLLHFHLQREAESRFAADRYCAVNKRNSLSLEIEL